MERQKASVHYGRDIAPRDVFTFMAAICINSSSSSLGLSNSNPHSSSEAPTTMSSVVIQIHDGEIQPSPKPDEPRFGFYMIINYVTTAVTSNCDMRKLVHSIKVGIALVLVSLLYVLEPLYGRVGENAMWAIMTVVVIFEFYAGATLSKGINRGIGTILGGGLGCMVAVLAQEFGGGVDAIIVGTSIFIFAAVATYIRLIPKIKKRHEYGAMIFILTFSLVVVSGIRADEVMSIARERLATIGMGFAICIFTSLLVFPNWASDELHASVSSKFKTLAHSLEGCFEEYFEPVDEKETKEKTSCKGCKSVLNSKSNEEVLANFAKWEPWHGKFGLSHPWSKYLKIGELLRELAATIVALRTCLHSPKQPTNEIRGPIKEPCETVVSSLAWTLKELGESVMKMRRCQIETSVIPKLKSTRLEMSLVEPSRLGTLQNGEETAVATAVFLLNEVVEKVEELAKEVEELGELAGFTVM